MNKIISIGLLAAGVILLVWGINASHSFASSTVEAFTGAPADRTIWLIIAGIILALGGVAGLISPRKG